MNHSPNFFTQGQSRDLRLPPKFKWGYHATWFFMTLLLMLIVINLFQVRMVSNNAEDLQTELRIEQNLRNNLMADISELRNSEREKQRWSPLVSLRPSNASKLSMLLETIPDTITVSRVTSDYNTDSIDTVSLRMDLSINAPDQQTMDALVESFRTRFSNELQALPQSHTLTRWVPLRQPLSRTVVQRGINITQFRTSELWNYELTPFSEADLMVLYNRLDELYPQTIFGNLILE